MKVCPICGKEVIKKENTFCSVSCATVHTSELKRKPKHTKVEIEAKKLYGDWLTPGELEQYIKNKKYQRKCVSIRIM